jgi:TPR repeat protein
MRGRVLVGSALALLSAPALAAAEPDFAYGAYQRGLYLTAYREATARLERDPADAAAMTLLGELHNQGLGVPQNLASAVEWYRLAAGRGDPNALYALGVMAVDGRGMAKDSGRGRAFFEEAAAKGEARAAYNLALLFLASEDPKDIVKAVEFLRRASEAEIGQAQHALGVLHLKGRGVARDPAEAARWFGRAAKNGSVAGEVEYAILQFNGEGLPANEAAAARSFRRAAMKGNAIAQNRLARLYVTGRGVPANKIEAAAWHLMASAQGLSDPWLEDALRGMPADDKIRAEQIAADRMGAI